MEIQMKKVSVQFNMKMPSSWTHRQLKEHLLSCIPDEVTSMQINNVEVVKKGK